MKILPAILLLSTSSFSMEEKNPNIEEKTITLQTEKTFSERLQEAFFDAAEFGGVENFSDWINKNLDFNNVS